MSNIFIMRKLSLTCFFIFTIGSLSFSQEKKAESSSYFDSENFIHEFIEDLSDDSIALDIILSQKVKLSAGIDREKIDYLIASLQEIRFNLQLKDPEKIIITPFTKLSRQEKRNIDLEKHAPEDVYFIQHNKKNVFALLLGDNKVSSFTLVSKGKNKSHFVTY